MPAARSEHRKAAALPTSSRVTLRRRGATSATRLSILRNPGMPAAARVFIGPAEMALTRTPWGPKSAARKRTFAKASLEANVRFLASALGPEGVVARNRAYGAEIGQCQQRPAPARHQRLRPLRERGEAVARDLVRHAEALAAGGLEEAPGERLTRRVRDRVHEDIELTPLASEPLEGGIALLVEGDIERHGEARPERMRERLDALFHLVVDVGEGELGTLAVHGLRDAPRDGAIGRNAYDEGTLAGEKSHDEPPGADYAGSGAARTSAASGGACADGCAASARRAGASPRRGHSRRAAAV